MYRNFLDKAGITVTSMRADVNMANFENEGSASDKELNESNISTGGENSQDSQDEVENNARTDEEQKEKLVKLPLGRIKTIVKMDPEVNMVNQEAVFLIAKSTVIIKHILHVYDLLV